MEAGKKLGIDQRAYSKIECSNGTTESRTMTI